jgi:MFS family permease
MRIGAKRVYIFSILLSSTATFGMATIYFLDDIHLILAIILRFMSGFGFGPALPAAFTFWTVWAVPLERSTLISVGFCSMHLGTGNLIFFSIYIYYR